MDYESIIKEISDGLTGGWQADIPYLQSKMEEYKDHELGPEIIKELGRMIYAALPEEQKAELAAALQRDSVQIQSILDDADACIERKDYPRALELLESAVDAVSAFGLQTEDKVSVYLSMSEPFNEMLYSYRFDPEKDIRPAALPAGEIYYKYGSLLFETGDFDGALKALETACSWDPMNADYNFEYLETLKALGRLDEFLEKTKAFLKNCFRPWSFAKACRNLAFCYIEQKRLRDAVICLNISAEYDPDSEELAAERRYITELNGGNEITATLVERKIFCLNEKIDDEPDHAIYALADETGNYYYSAGEFEKAAYFYTIAADLFPGISGTAIERLKEIFSKQSGGETAETGQ